MGQTRNTLFIISASYQETRFLLLSPTKEESMQQELQGLVKGARNAAVTGVFFRLPFAIAEGKQKGLR